MNNYYVYNHVDTSGEIVYIGKGRYSRAWVCSQRKVEHKAWMESELPFLKVVIVASGCSEIDALKIEKDLILTMAPKFNIDHTPIGINNRKAQGHWLSKNHSRFSDVTLQTELGKRGAESSKHPNKVLKVCDHCDAEMNLGHIARYHDDNCKQRVSANDTDRT